MPEPMAPRPAKRIFGGGGVGVDIFGRGRDRGVLFWGGGVEMNWIVGWITLLMELIGEKIGGCCLLYMVLYTDENISSSQIRKIYFPTFPLLT